MRRFATFVLDTAFLLLGRAAHVVFHLFGWRFISFTGKLSGDIVYVLNRRKGFILPLPHFGPFLLPLPYLGFMGYRVDQVTGGQIHASLAGERFWEWRKREAEKLPVRFLQVGRFLRPLYQALGGNETG